MTSPILGSSIFRRSAPIALVVLLFTISWPMYVHLTNRETLEKLDHAAEATSLHTPLPSEMAVVHDGERHALYLTSHYPASVVAALLEMPSLQVESTFMVWWVLPLLIMILVAYVRRRASTSLGAFLTAQIVIGSVLLATNGIVAVVAVWALDEPKLLAVRSALWISLTLTAATAAYASCFVFIHHHFGRVSNHWWTLSILTLTLAWCIRTGLPFLGYGSVALFLPGGVERFLFDPDKSKATLGFAICLCWSALFMASCIKRQPGAVNSDLPSYQRAFSIFARKHLGATNNE